MTNTETKPIELTALDRIAALERVVAANDHEVIALKRNVKAFTDFFDTVHDAMIDLDHALTAAIEKGD